MAYNEELVTRIRDLLEDRFEVEEKKMFGGLTFMVNGNMACGVTGDILVVRVGADHYDEALEREALVRDRFHHAVATYPHGLAGDVSIAVLPVVVHSAEDPEYLRDGLSDMLASRFERLGSIDLVRGEVDGRGTTDGEKARALAREAGADYVLYGSFTRFGQGASLDVQCAPLRAETDREPLREIFVHSGSIGEIIPDLDELAGKVSRFVRGERVVSGVPAAAGGGVVGASAGEVDALRERVEALEAAIRALADES